VEKSTTQITTPPVPPVSQPLQQIVILAGNSITDATTSPLSDNAQIISIDPSQLNQILAVAQQQQNNEKPLPSPPPKD
jgi:hypothetical protein